MADWWSIEVFSSDKLPASAWRYAYEDQLTEAAVTHGAVYYDWQDTQYGVLFEVVFPGDREWDNFRSLVVVRAALDGVPDPAEGLLIYRGRGGAAGSPKPRKPKPAPGAAALELEEPRRVRKLARRLKYNGGGTDLNELRRELLGEPPADPGPVAEPGPAPGPPPEPLWVDPGGAGQLLPGFPPSPG